MIKINGEEWSAKKLMILVPGIKESAATARLKRYKQGLCPRDYMLRPIEKNKSQNNTHHPKLVKINGEEWTTAKIIKKVPGICRSTAAKRLNRYQKGDCTRKQMLLPMNIQKSEAVKNALSKNRLTEEKEFSYDPVRRARADAINRELEDAAARDAITEKRIEENRSWR